jgi:hypothetical protein
MKMPTDAQARLLALIHDRVNPDHGEYRYVGRGKSVWTHSEDTGYFLGRVRVETATRCVLSGWLEISEDSEAWLTEAGVIVLGLWRVDALRRPPTLAPSLTDRERQIVDLAVRARDLGYTLAPLEPARTEANRLRRAGWFTRCWIANNARGLVPTPLALVEIRPDTADTVTNARTIT